MKQIKNFNMRTKLFIMTLPLMIALIASVAIAGVKISRTEKQVTAVYYDELYTVNGNLVNADRDFYQALLAACQYREYREGYSSATGSVLEQTLEDYESNKRQVLEHVANVSEVAGREDSLFLETLTENGANFSQTVEEFRNAFDQWEKAYDVKQQTGSWQKFNHNFEIARDHLDEMQ